MRAVYVAAFLVLALLAQEPPPPLEPHVLPDCTGLNSGPLDAWLNCLTAGTPTPTAAVE